MLGTHVIKTIEGIRIELLKCPFCGSDPEWVVVPGEDFIMRCSSCHASTAKAQMSPERAAADWNAGNIADDHFTIPDDTPIDDYLSKGIKKVFFSEYSIWDKYPDIENGFLCSEMVIVTEEMILCVDPHESILLYDEISGYNPDYYHKPPENEDEPIHFVRSELRNGFIRSLVLRCGEKEYVIRADKENECMAVTNRK